MPYTSDRSKSDRITYSPEAKKIIEGLFGRPITIVKATDLQDMDHSIDVFINGEPIQMRWQFLENKKTRAYWPTLRYKREHSSRPDQYKSELFKIIDNRRRDEPYPKKLIWGLVDLSQSIKIVRLVIIDLDDFVKKYINKEYHIWDGPLGGEHIGFPEDWTEDEHCKQITLEVIENKDNSSSFLVLNDVKSVYSYP